MDNVQLTFKKISPVALLRFQSRVHSVHTTLKTTRKKMSANPCASILYGKKYNMRHPIFASIILLLPTHTQDKAGGFVQKSETQFLPESKPHAQKLLTQFLRHLPTHHPEIETNNKMIPKMTKSGILKDLPDRKKRGMACYSRQRAVWHNGGCTSLNSVAEQQVKWLVARVCSPPLRQAAGR
jgi:hypothetical protein